MGVVAVFAGGVASHSQLKDKEINGIIDHADGSITTEKIRDGAITASKLSALDHINLVPRSDDPALAAGRLWYRSDLGRLCYSPDGSAVRCLPLPPIGTDDIADRAVTRAKLEYPTVDIPLLYLYAIGKAFIDSTDANRFTFIITADEFADKQIAGVNLMKYAESRYYEGFFGRTGSDPRANAYITRIDTGHTTADVLLEKVVAGTVTSLGVQAVDLLDDTAYIFGLSCTGSTISTIRYSRWTITSTGVSFGTATVAVSATDTAHASGRFAARASNVGGPGAAAEGLLAVLRAPSSPQPKPIAYLEVPVVGSGTPDDPFRARMPEEIAWEWSLNPQAKRKYDILKAKGFTDEEIIELLPEVLSARVNRLALTHSSLIKTDRATGRPVEYVAIVRIFEQPDRPAYLYPIDRALEALKSMPGVRVLDRDEAIRRAKQIDPDLTDVDLLPIPSTGPRFKQILKDYIAHRIAMGVREELIDEKLMERYLQEDKGW